MKQQIHDTILSILAEKRADGDVLPFATSIEVAHRLHLGAREVEKIAEEIDVWPESSETHSQPKKLNQ